MMRLIKGDCLEEMNNLISEGVKVDLILTDPPYGTSKCKWDSIISLEEMWQCINALSKETTPTLLFSDDKFGVALKNSNFNDYRYHWVWNKEYSTNFMQAKKRPLNPLEYVNVFYQKQPKYNPQMRKKTIDYDRTRVSDADKKVKNIDGGIHGKHYASSYYIDDGKRYPINLIPCNSQKGETNNYNRVHPSQKPVPLLEYFIKTYTDEGDTVLDFTMGSGSTGVACKNMNRNFIGIELDEDYFNLAKKRCNETQTKLT